MPSRKTLAIRFGGSRSLPLRSVGLECGSATALDASLLDGLTAASSCSQNPLCRR